MKDFLSQAAKLLKEQKQYRRRVAVFLCLAVIVGYGTVMALKLYGQAMTHKMEVLDCQYEVHEHTDECYERDEEGNRILEEPVCGYADYVIHVHNDNCYDKDGNLVCTLEEHEPHKHTEECYVTEKVLVCGEGEDSGSTAEVEGAAGGEENSAGNGEEASNGEGLENTGTSAESGEALVGNAEEKVGGEASGGTEAPDSTAEIEGVVEPLQQEIICEQEVHNHDESCYEKALSCGYAEEHIHNADCIAHELNCETVEHTHGEGCYDGDGSLICEIAEHIHEIGCYDEEGNTLCNTQDHVHDESCLNAEGKIACGPEGHDHITGCYRNFYGCEKEEHVHSESCYTQNQICQANEHEHEDACFAQTEEFTENEADLAENSDVSGGSGEFGTVRESASAEGGKSGAAKDMDPEAGKEAAANGSGGHVHTDACYEVTRLLICGKQELHTHDAGCYAADCFDEDGNLIEGSRPSCGLLELREHIHGEDCFRTVELTPEEVEALNNGVGLHVHTDICYGEDGRLICGQEETHRHGVECYDESGNLVCDYEEQKNEYYCGKEEHTHGEGCWDSQGNLICGLEEHTHNGICLLEEPTFYCEKEEHLHVEDCCDMEENLICEKEEHIHSESCLKEPVYYCGKVAHLHSGECYDEVGNLVCGLEGHTHNEICLIEDPFFYCGQEEHVHGENCCDADGNLTCEMEEHLHDERCLIPGIKLTAETEDYFITLEASVDAFPDVEGELTLEAVKLAEDSPEHEVASQLVEEKLEQDRIENEEAEEDNSEAVNAFPFDISIKGADGEEIPVQMQGEKEWEQRIFDIRVLADGGEVQPVMPVRVSFIRKTKEEMEAISGEKPEEENIADGKTTGGSADSDEEVRIFHVDPEKALVEDMNAEKDEEGNAIIDTPHFSEYSVLTVKKISDGTTMQVTIPEESTPWQSLAMLFYKGSINGCEVEIKLQGDLVVENLDANNNPIDASPIWIDSNRKLILDLNGHKISSGKSTINQKDWNADGTSYNMAWFRVSNSNGTGELIIRDSASDNKPYSSIDKRFDEELEVIPEYNEQTWAQGYHGEYDFAKQKAVYYLTESNRLTSAKTEDLSKISPVTTEHIHKHEISFEGIGAIENTEEDDLTALIWTGNGGKVTIQSGRLTNLYGSAIMSPEGGKDKKEITIEGGYLVGNGQKKARDWGGAVFVDGNGDITIGEKAVIIVNKSNSEGGGVHLDSKQTTPKPSVLIKEGCIVSGNETAGRGGGVNVKGVNLTVEGGVITNNFAGSGGGLSVDGEFVIKDGVIAGNAVSGGGGGLYIGTSDSGTIAGGVIASNRARAEGGGIRLESGYVALAADENSLLYITNNKTISNTGGSRDWGGGGIFISEGNGQMTIYDAIVTQNTAKGFGGGVSGCSTGRLSIEETRGAAIYGNTAIGGTPAGDIIDGLSGGSSSKHDDHDAYISDIFNAKDASGNYKRDFQDIFSALSSIVGPKMLGGGAVNWTGSCDYVFVEDNSQDIISTKLLGLTAHPEDKAVNEARKIARVFISGNYSGTHGGGIMCNGLIVLGNKDQILYNESLTMDFLKSYLGVDGNPKTPTDGQFEFELLDAEGKQLVVYSTTANPNTSGTNVLGVLGINFKKDGTLPTISGADPVEVIQGDGAIGRHTYYLKEIIPEDQGFMKYDDAIYKIEFDVKCKGKKITLGKNYEVTQYWLYIDGNNAKVSVVDKVGTESSEIPGATVNYEFSSIGDYGGNTQHKGGHLSIHGKSLSNSDGQDTTNAAFVNGDKVKTLALKILKTNGLQVEQGKPGYMAYVDFQLTALTEEGRKEEGKTGSGKTNEQGEVEFSSIPNVSGKYLLEEIVPEGFEQAGPWFVETDGKDNISVYAAEGKEVTSSADGATNTYWVYEKKSGDKLTVEAQKESNGSIKFLINIVNTPILYSLPETGGTGTILYTMAGAMFLLLGAGLLYRKKFGERRAKNL